MSIVAFLNTSSLIPDLIVITQNNREEEQHLTTDKERGQQSVDTTSEKEEVESSNCALFKLLGDCMNRKKPRSNSVQRRKGNEEEEEENGSNKMRIEKVYAEEENKDEKGSNIDKNTNLKDPYLDVMATLKHVYCNKTGTEVTSEDKETAASVNNSLCFGEVLPEGVIKMFDVDHLDVENAAIVFDIGMGIGKLAMQAFLEYDLDKVVGVEFCESRAATAFDALSVLAQGRRIKNGYWRFHRQFEGSNTGNFKCASITEEKAMEPTKQTARNGTVMTSQEIVSRTLEFRQQDMFDTAQEICFADIIICETKVRPSRFRSFRELLSNIHIGARILTYENLEAVYKTHLNHADPENTAHTSSSTSNASNEESEDGPFRMPFKRLECNMVDDRFLTTWSSTYGHHFYLYTKVE